MENLVVLFGKMWILFARFRLFRSFISFLAFNILLKYRSVFRVLKNSLVFAI